MTAEILLEHFDTFIKGLLYTSLNYQWTCEVRVLKILKIALHIYMYTIYKHNVYEYNYHELKIDLLCAMLCMGSRIRL